MTDLRSLVDPLLHDPPHPAPPVDELQRRVDRRRRRRARAIGASSVVAVILVATAVVALPRSSELRVGDDPTSSTTPTPPPPEPNPVEVIVTPESASADTPRSIVQRNTGSELYDACGKVFDLFRWDGRTWQGVASNVLSGDGGFSMQDFDPSAATAEAQCATSTPLAPGAEVAVATVQPNRSTWYAPAGTRPLPADQLTGGWYELRQVHVYQGEPAIGRFEIDDSDDAAIGGPMADADVELTVSPAAAPLTADRTLLFTNTSDQPYTECGGRFELRRWDGTSWVPVGIYHTMTDPPFLQALDAPFTDGRCVAPYTVRPHDILVTYLNPGTTVRSTGSGTIPATQEPLEPGRYELAGVADSTSPLSAVGRFEITGQDQDPSDGAVSTVTTEPGQVGQTVDGIAVESTIDAWPGEPLIETDTVLPDQLVVVDDRTVAMTWQGPCNQPADHVDVRATEDEVEVRLHVGTFLMNDCMGEPDRWVLTLDLGVGLGDRRLVAHDEDGGAITVEPADHPEDADPPGYSIPPGPTRPVSFHVVEDGPGAFHTVLPWPLAPTTLWCEQQSYDVGSLVVILVREQASPNAGATNGCGAPYSYRTGAGETMFGSS